MFVKVGVSSFGVDGVHMPAMWIGSITIRHEDMAMKNPPHPRGWSVRRDGLEPLGLSVTEAAKRLGVSRKQASGIVNGHSGISPEMAIRLDEGTGLFGGGI